ncbi:MAG: hypothetical protein ACREYC_15200 [Gammaproteobacteria bacterium]
MARADLVERLEDGLYALRQPRGADTRIARASYAQRWAIIGHRDLEP